MRDPLTIDDVLSSRWIAYPFHIYDCCLVTDAGGAVVVVGADRARDLKKKPVWVLGSGEASTHQSHARHARHHADAGALLAARRAFEMAGVTHEDIDVVEVYDSFTYTALVTLEELGFCEKGEGGPFVVEPAHGARRRLPDEHERRRPLVHAPRHVRHVHPHRGGAAAARRVRRAPGEGREARAASTAPAAC